MYDTGSFMKELMMLTPVIHNDDGTTTIEIPTQIAEALNIGPGSEVCFDLDPKTNEIIMRRKNPIKTFAVETFTIFRHVYLVEAENESDAIEYVKDTPEDDYPVSFQKFISEEVYRSGPVTNAQIVTLIQETEQPTMTLEKLESGDWLKNCVNVVRYHKPS
jgi:bifunctional DNA-binding transcriptional regulator/antitoxin component of YhaV-PrlF toxin-antitoxin module